MSDPAGMGRITELAVGERFHLKRGKDNILYAGMVSDDVYSIVQVKASGYQGYAWHLFYPRRKRDLIVDGVAVYVENVTPDHLTLRVE